MNFGRPSPRWSRRWNFEISATGGMTRHGVINWEEFGEKIWWVVLHSAWSTKMPRKFRPKFRPILRPILRPTLRPVKKICHRNFALGNVRRNEFLKTCFRIRYNFGPISNFPCAEIRSAGRGLFRKGVVCVSHTLEATRTKATIGHFLRGRSPKVERS